jgi:hypothetical protein
MTISDLERIIKKIPDKKAQIRMIYPSRFLTKGREICASLSASYDEKNNALVVCAEIQSRADRKECTLESILEQS